MRPWDGIISEEEQRAYRAAGFGRPTGVGKRPALLIIDDCRFIYVTHTSRWGGIFHELVYAACKRGMSSESYDD